MKSELMNNKPPVLPALSNMELCPALLEDERELATYTRLPLTQLSALGTAFEPLTAAVQNVLGEQGATSGIYKVTIPKGTHLAEFKSGQGNLGTVLNANNQLAGQAVLNPLVCDPTMLFMAAVISSIDKKLDSIQELQQEMMSFLVQKERSELRGNLIFLSDVLNNYKYNWDNDMYKNSNHIKVLDIRQTAEQKIFFYRDQIKTKLQKKTIIHSDKDALKQIDRIQSDFKEYQLALYMHGFSSFMDVMLVGNYDSDYLRGIRGKIEDYSWRYRELYTECYNQLEAYTKSTVQFSILKGLETVSTVAGERISKIPVLNKAPVDEALIGAGDRLNKMESKKKTKQLHKLINRQNSCVGPFVESIETVDRFYNRDMIMAFDKDTVYFGTTEGI